MTVILALKGVRNSHEHNKTRISQFIIMMEKVYNKYVGGPPEVKILDDIKGVTAPGSKSLLSVDNNSSSRSGG